MILGELHCENSLICRYLHWTCTIVKHERDCKIFQHSYWTTVELLLWMKYLCQKN